MKPAPTEHAEQSRVVVWFHHAYPKHRGALVAIPNAGKRSKVMGARMKREGMQPGVLDLFLRVPTADHHGLWIEMKRRGATPSDVADEQFADIGHCLRAGYAATWCAGADEAQRVIAAYMSNSQTRAMQ